ncbi:hypothetical protein [Stutzerimonas nitrititolerans]|uniref:hypothetical protein n=1 Tax=Stutzerimonas nitrititolerans TaxID=2482751 RepID=UPI0028B10AD0|nr:hypothetical protein [Stutzerimonas nitrititolerans]
MKKSSNATKQLDDAVFGKMEYKHSWYKMQSIRWWGIQELDVKITAHAYTGKNITEQQRNAFIEYQREIEDIIVNSAPILRDSLHSIFDVNYTTEELFIELTPRTVLFLEDGDWGILFDSKSDIEHGIALYKHNGIWKAGPQDDFL